MTTTLLQGDCREILPTLPERSVQCCVTSPPYFGLRNYGVDGQIGLETTVSAYLAVMVNVFREVWRVLRNDGTLWLNLGDAYNGHGPSSANQARVDGGKQRLHDQAPYSGAIRLKGLGAKQLLGIPWRVALALQDAGWILRSEIIWHKTNPMPESVTDRPTRAHEHLFLFAKNEQYYYDAAAIAEPATEPERKRSGRFGGSTGHLVRHLTRNRRSVWSLASQPTPYAHYATFPEKLIEPCVLAGSAARACEACGAPWGRVIEETGHINKREPAHVPGNTATKTDSTGWAPTKRATGDRRSICTCPNDGTARSIVLDPFAGSGTTLRVAERLGRDSIGIELNPAYISLQEQRTNGVQKFMTDLL